MVIEKLKQYDDKNPTANSTQIFRKKEAPKGQWTSTTGVWVSALDLFTSMKFDQFQHLSLSNLQHNFASKSF